MTNEEYKDVVTSIQLVAGVADTLPLEAFIAQAERSLEVGAAADAALYARVGQRLELLIATARLLRGVQLLNRIAREDGVI